MKKKDRRGFLLLRKRRSKDFFAKKKNGTFLAKRRWGEDFFRGIKNPQAPPVPMIFASSLNKKSV